MEELKRKQKNNYRRGKDNLKDKKERDGQSSNHKFFGSFANQTKGQRRYIVWLDNKNAV